MPKKLKPQNVELTKTDYSNQEGQKRQHFPYVLKGDCPKCGESMECDFNDQYIGYPRFGNKEKVSLYCYECDRDFEVIVVPDIELTLKLK